MDLSDLYRKKSTFGKKLLIFLGIVILVIALTVGGHWLLQHQHKSKPAATNNTAATTSRVSTPSPTQQYSSDNLGLSFNYPKNWVIVDTTGSNQLTVTSTPTKLLNPSGSQITGKIIMTIDDSAPSKLNALSGGDATASLQSQLINYTNPSPDQKASTYVSFLHYASENTSSSTIDGIFVTGNDGYTVNQNVPQSDVIAQSPIIYYSFVGCSDSSCSGTAQPTGIPTNLWANKSFSSPLLSMLESLSIN